MNALASLVGSGLVLLPLVIYLVAVWAMQKLDRARIRENLMRSGCEILVCATSTCAMENGAKRAGYRVRYRDAEGRVISQFCETGMFSGVNWLGDADVAAAVRTRRYPSLFPRRRLDVASKSPSNKARRHPAGYTPRSGLFLNHGFRCPDCGWNILGHRRFVIPERQKPLPPCRIRAYADSDFEACAELYRSNESGRFPAGYFDEYCKALKAGKALFLICEVDGKIIGAAGALVIPSAKTVTLVYGLIAPSHHSKGFGTAMLLARLAVLPDPPSNWNAFMFAVIDSVTFYKRFGFDGELAADENGVKLWNLGVSIEAADIVKSRELLAAGNIAVEFSSAPPRREQP